MPRSAKRIIRQTQHLKRVDCDLNKGDLFDLDDHFRLFQRYIAARHGGGGGGDMMNITKQEFLDIVRASPARSHYYQWYDSGFDSGFDSGHDLNQNRLLAGCLVDRVHNGLSAVYSFFDPDYEKLSLGRMMIQQLIALAKTYELSYVYLGYWVADCKKMQYKANFQPLEYYIDGKWVREFTPADPSTQEK